MKIAIGNDHAAVEMKLAIKAHLEGRGIEVADMGTGSSESCDYPVYGERVGRAVASGEADLGIYYHYGIDKVQLDKKVFGVFRHRVMNRKIPLVRGFDDVFFAPHSRHTEVPMDKIRAEKRLTVLAESEEAGLFLAMAEDGRQIFVMGHPEYDRVTLDGEYKRDLSKGLPIEVPENYYEGDDPENKPLLTWRAHANNLYTNWLNYYVYQQTPYEFIDTSEISSK